MSSIQPAVVLVGHGGLPKDCPPELVRELKRLESQRKTRGGPPSKEERELDMKIRTWPRTPQNDPYKTGLESLASHLAPMLNGRRLVVAYNEFCAPSLEQAVAALAAEGCHEVTVVTTMITPGGSHADREIPEAVTGLAERFPHLDLRYAWPFDLPRVAAMLNEQVNHARSRID